MTIIFGTILQVLSFIVRMPERLARTLPFLFAQRVRFRFDIIFVIAPICVPHFSNLDFTAANKSVDGENFQ